jgi:hypothetical protein
MGSEVPESDRVLKFTQHCWKYYVSLFMIASWMSACLSLALYKYTEMFCPALGYSYIFTYIALTALGMFILEKFIKEVKDEG